MSRGKVLAGPEGQMIVAELVLNKTLQDPEMTDLMEQMIADKEVTREQIYHTAFVQGVLSTLAAVMAGKIAVVKPENS